MKLFYWLVLVTMTTTTYSSIFEKVDYKQLNCTTKNKLCPLEKLAMDHVYTGKFNWAESHLSVKKNKLQKLIADINLSVIDYKKASTPGERDKILIQINKIKKNILWHTELYLSEIRSAESLMSEYNVPGEEEREKYQYCQFDKPYNTKDIYHLCGVMKLRDKLRLMANTKSELVSDTHYIYLEDMLKSYVSYFENIESRISPLEISSSSMQNISYYSVIGNPKEWLKHIEKPFRRYSEAAGRFAQTVFGLDNKIDQMTKISSRKDAIQSELEQVENGLGDQKQIRKAIEKKVDTIENGISDAKGQLKSTQDRLKANFGTIVPKGSLQVIKSETITYNRNNFLDNKHYPGTIPNNISHLKIYTPNDLIIKSNGFWRMNRMTNYKILGILTDSNGYHGQYFNHKDMPSSTSPIGTLLLNVEMDNPYTVHVGNGGLIQINEAISNKRFGFIINDLVEKMGLNDCPNPRGLDKQCFSIGSNNVVFQVEYLRSKNKIFTDVLTYLEVNLLKVIKGVEHSTSPFVTAINIIRDKLKDVTPNIEPFMPLVNHAVNIKLLEKRILDLINQKSSFDADFIAIDAKIRDLNKSIASLERVLNSINVDETKARMIVKNYYFKKLKLEKSLLNSSLMDYKEWLKVYVDSILYRDPKNTKILEKSTKINKLISRYIEMEAVSESSEFLNKDLAAIKDNICSPLKEISDDIYLVCKKYQDVINDSEINNALVEFLDDQDEEWNIEQIMTQTNLHHCEINLGRKGSKGNQYLVKHFDVDSVAQLFKADNTRGKFFTPQFIENTKFYNSRFNLEKACKTLPPNEIDECLQSNDIAKKMLEDYEGYFEFSFSSRMSSPHYIGRNMSCDKDSTYTDIPKLLGVAIEWKHKKIGGNDQYLKTGVLLEKSNVSGWNDFSNLEEQDEYKVGQYLVNVRIPKRYDASAFSKDVPLLQEKFVKKYCDDYSSVECARKILGSNVIGKKQSGYSFSTRFLNSYGNNDWTLRIPLFKPANKADENEKFDRSYFREIADKIVNLRIHFYFSVNTTK